MFLHKPIVCVSVYVRGRCLSRCFVSYLSLVLLRDIAIILNLLDFILKHATLVWPCVNQPPQSIPDHLDGLHKAVLKPLDVFSTDSWKLHVLIHPEQWLHDVCNCQHSVSPDLSGRRGVKDWPLRYTTGSCLMLVHSTLSAPHSEKICLRLFWNPSIVGCPVPNTRYPGTLQFKEFEFMHYVCPPLSQFTCLKLGAPSWIGSLASSLWIFSKWSYLSTQTFMGLFCSLLLASSLTFFWYLSLLIHSHLFNQHYIRLSSLWTKILPLLLQLYHDGLTGCGRHCFSGSLISLKWLIITI